MDFLTVADFARLMHVRQTQAYALLAAGVAPSVKINGRRRIPRAAWEQWYSEQTAKALASVKTPGQGTPRSVRVSHAG
jgi:excisionase family DNA binding protein